MDYSIVRYFAETSSHLKSLSDIRPSGLLGFIFVPGAALADYECKKGVCRHMILVVAFESSDLNSGGFRTCRREESEVSKAVLVGLKLVLRRFE